MGMNNEESIEMETASCLGRIGKERKVRER